LTATTVTDCAAQNKVCVAGACVPVVCPAGMRYCDNNDLRTCSTKGDTSSLYQSCGTLSYCDSTGSPPTCKTRVCTPDQPACSSQIATTCNSVGSGYLSGGVDCSATSQVCVSGVCMSLACAPSSYYCNSGNVYHCSTDGLSSALYTTCLATQYCDSSTTTATCKAQICSPDQPACNGNIATFCNPDGSGFTGIQTDCTATAQTCSAGVCSNVAVDNADPSPTSGTASSVAAATKIDYFSVTSTRTLSKIEAYLSPTNGATLTWVVYEATTQTGTYSLISSSTSAVGTGYAYYGSGPLSVTLTAGRFYAIGVGWNNTTAYYYKMNPAAAIPLSFGSALGGATITSGATSFLYTNTNLYTIRLTTSP
jgi:hypothetical protein